MQERKQIEWSARMKGVAALEKSERQRYEVTVEEMKNKEDFERKDLAPWKRHRNEKRRSAYRGKKNGSRLLARGRPAH